MADLAPTRIELESAGRCRIVSPTGRMYYSTPAAVGLALLQQEPDEETSARQITWHDHLATHGMAIGTRGATALTLAVLPPTLRTIRWDGPREGTDRQGRPLRRSREYTVTFPHMLVGMAMRAGRFLRGGLWCVNPTTLSALTVVNPALNLAAFPFSNVYAGRGAICWGTVPHGDIRTLAEFLDRFFTSGFNGDLYNQNQIGVTSAFPELATSSPTLPTCQTWNQGVPQAIQILASDRG